MTFPNVNIISYHYFHTASHTWVDGAVEQSNIFKPWYAYDVCNQNYDISHLLGNAFYFFRTVSNMRAYSLLTPAYAQ